MSILATHSEVRELLRPEPRSPIAIRVAIERDLKFIDDLQKKHGKMVAFASHKELRSYIEQGQTALIAEEGSLPLPSGEGWGEGAHDGQVRSDPPSPLTPLPQGEGNRSPIGYCLYRDRYMKREDCGYVSQLVVDSSKHRGLVGAALVQAMFERLPYGVRLFCLWCAQDLEANHFWEALGFVPLAYRAGSRGKEHGGRRSGGTRVQIFWERRVRDGDEYPYWYPSQTSNGRMGESRIVLPIPPGKHWSDELLLVLPGVGSVEPLVGDSRMLEGEKAKRSRAPRKKTQAAPISMVQRCGLRFGPPTPPTSEPKPAADAPKPKVKREKHKNDPKLVAAAREFRDRYLEQVNTGLILPPGSGKYDVSRQLEAAASTLKQTPLLKAA
jgi:hypothetical protein